MHRMRVCGLGDNVVDRYFDQKMMFPRGTLTDAASDAAQYSAGIWRARGGFGDARSITREIQS